MTIGDLLESFYVWCRDNDGAAIVEAPSIVAQFMESEGYKEPDVTPHYVFKLTEKLHSLGLASTCLSCKHYEVEEGRIVCGLVGQVPPPNVVVKGCPSWDGNLPF